MITPKIHQKISTQSPIAYVLADINYSVFYLENGKKYMSGYTLKHHESYLDLKQFMRVNRSIIIHKSFVKGIIERDKINYLILQNGNDIAVPRRRVKEIQSQFENLNN